MGAMRHARMGGLGIGERKDLVDNGLDLARLDQRPHLAQERVADCAFLLRRARPQGGGEQRKPLHQHGREIHARLHPAHIGDIALNVIASDHIENDVNAAAARFFFDDIDEILFAVVDGARCAKSFARRTSLRAACRSEDLVASRMKHLDRCGADPAGTAMDEHGLARLAPRAVDQIGPHREMHFGKRCRVCERDAARHREHA